MNRCEKTRRILFIFKLKYVLLHAIKDDRTGATANMIKVMVARGQNFYLGLGFEVKAKMSSSPRNRGMSCLLKHTHASIPSPSSVSRREMDS